jgi:hypothetical protein
VEITVHMDTKPPAHHDHHICRGKVAWMCQWRSPPCRVSVYECPWRSSFVHSLQSQAPSSLLLHPALAPLVVINVKVIWSLRFLSPTLQPHWNFTGTFICSSLGHHELLY